jgi:hypothetical protein
MERLGRVLEALSEPVQVASIKTVVEELTGQIFDPGDNWQGALFDHLITNEYVFQSTQVLQKPKRLEEAAWATSQRVAKGRLAQGDQANAELLAYLILGAGAQKNGEALLRPKVHFFLRGLDEMVVALAGTDKTPKAELAWKPSPKPVVWRSISPRSCWNNRKVRTRDEDCRHGVLHRRVGNESGLPHCLRVGQATSQKWWAPSVRERLAPAGFSGWMAGCLDRPTALSP